MDEVVVIPRRFSVYRRMQVRWVEGGDGGRLEPVVWTGMFVATWAAVLMPFLVVGVTWAVVMARAGYAVAGTAGLCWVVVMWSAAMGVDAHGARVSARGGVVCEVGGGKVRLLREGVEVPLGDVRVVRRVRFRSGNQLQLVTDGGVVHVATRVWPRSAGKRLAREIGVAYEEKR